MDSLQKDADALNQCFSTTVGSIPMSKWLELLGEDDNEKAFQRFYIERFLNTARVVFLQYDGDKLERAYRMACSIASNNGHNLDEVLYQLLLERLESHNLVITEDIKALMNAPDARSKIVKAWALISKDGVLTNAAGGLIAAAVIGIISTLITIIWILLKFLPIIWQFISDYVKNFNNM